MIEGTGIQTTNKPVISDQEIRNAMKIAVEQVRRNLLEFTTHCQNHSSVDGFYPPCENNQWTCGFWPGEVWLAYEHTGDPIFRDAGLILAESFYERIEKKIEVDHHDMGFLYSPSCVSAWMLTGEDIPRRAAILAARQLASRFQPVGGFIQAWGGMDDPASYRYIIDCLLNLPLLYWATAETGDNSFRTIAHRHIDTCLRYSIRADGSTHHTVYMNSKTGSMLRGATCQGYRDDSIWARGQAWAVYGTALSYRYTKDSAYLDSFGRVLGFYLSHLPEDLVPYWDMIFQDGDKEPRDSSSASIVVCGLLEMAGLVPEREAEEYRVLARQMLKSLYDNYAVKDSSISNGLVLHATYSKQTPFNTCNQEGVDECVGWGDYFYMEALTRLLRDWNPYW